jgi:hypothetical protein
MREKDRQEIEEKRRRIQDNIAKSKRQIESVKSPSVLEPKVSRTPLFIEYERRGKEIELREIERIKSQLQHIKEERSPRDPKELLEHRLRMESIVNEKVEKLRKARIGRQTAFSYDFSKYHTSFHDIVEQEKRAVLDEQERREK